MERIVRSILNELLSCIRNIYAVNWWTYERGRYSILPWWLDQLESVLLDLMRSGLRPEYIRLTSAPFLLNWATIEPVLHKEFKESATTSNTLSFIRDLKSFSQVPVRRNPGSVKILYLSTRDNPTFHAWWRIDISIYRYDDYILNEKIPITKISSGAFYSRGHIIDSNASISSLTFEGDIDTTITKDIDTTIKMYIRSAMRTVKYLASEFSENDVVGILKKANVLMQKLSELFRDAMTKWLHEHPEDREAMIWLCRHLHQSVREDIPWNWYQTAIKEIQYPINLALFQIKERYGESMLHRLYDAIGPGQHVLTDGEIKIAVWPSRGSLWNIGIAAAPRPYWIRRAIEWVHNQVVPDIFRQVKQIV